MGIEVLTVKVSVERPEVRNSNRCASTTDQFDTEIRTFCYPMVSDESL